jgi:hypothetical protein
MQLDLTNPVHERAYRCAARNFLSEIPAWEASRLQAALLDSDGDDADAISLWEPFESEEPEKVEEFISDLTRDILGTMAPEEVDPAPAHMLHTLVNLHEGVADGGKGITDQDWTDAKASLGLIPRVGRRLEGIAARSIIRFEPEVEPPTIPDGVRSNFQRLGEAAENGDLVLVPAKHTEGHWDFLVCAEFKQAGTVRISPFAAMIYGNPFELYEDPTQNA